VIWSSQIAGRFDYSRSTLPVARNTRRPTTGGCERKKHVTIPASRSQCGGSAAITDRTITPEPRAPTVWCWGLGPRTSSNLDHKNVPSLSIHRLGSRLENFPPRNPTGRAGVPPSSEMNRYQGPLKTDTVLAVPARHRASSTAYRAICAH